MYNISKENKKISTENKVLIVESDCITLLTFPEEEYTFLVGCSFEYLDR